MFFFGCFADAECLLLAAMAYDRYAAICNPLLYPTLMSSRVCVCFIVLAYLSGSMTSMVHVCLTFTLPFCGSNIVNHFFCDIPPLLALSCADTHINELLLFVLCGFIQTSTFMVIFISYFCILSTVLSIKSSDGRSKTFSTCASHLVAVTLFYGTLLFMYLRPTTSYSLNTDKSFFFAVYAVTEGILLSMMAYDRYVAIANPLLYTVIMTQKVCIQMVLASYSGGVINSLTHTVGLLRLDFCGPNIVNHYFCDIPPLLKLSCSDVHNNEMLLLIFSGVIGVFTFIIIMVSYICIIVAIQRIRSAQGRRKAFSTCVSHLTAVTLFYGSATFNYIQPSSQYSLDQEKVCAVFYTLVIPMLNPLIYSLRNKDVKDAAKRPDILPDDLPDESKAAREARVLGACQRLEGSPGSKKHKHMAGVNFTLVTEFILLGLTDRAELKVFLFVLFLLIYTISLVGNLGMLFLIHITPKLQTPMYHFLSCLSFVDACYSSVFAPKMLLNFFVEQKISFSACIVQYFLFVSLLTTEGFLLAAMAYDRYMAIANPLYGGYD
ncbi:Olfactory receptor 5AS1 [Myotis davidii]|uniref:Olfactory receptor 5AS1 n=1 Tax=Myotis davidii TaxID=225400 RepID=L5MBT6_MYODS|nr:Olfactory receptor 5AS1 [Myotis davidii]